MRWLRRVRRWDSIPVSLASPAAPAAYTFTVHATIPSGGPGGGCVIAVFQDASYVELNRAVIPILPLPSASARADGCERRLLGPDRAPAGRLHAVGTVRRIRYALARGGGDRARPQPVPVIGTASLPDGSVGGAYAQTLTRPEESRRTVGRGHPSARLSLRQDGTLRGTPTAAGSYTVSLSWSITQRRRRPPMHRCSS